MSTKTPHDALFKFVLGRLDDTRPLLRWILPASLGTSLDWSSLRMEPASFVDEALQDRHADVLFSATCGSKQVFIYFLLEHQSAPDRLMPYRMLVYITRIWAAFLEDHPDAKRLPAVVPVVFHHGDQRWTEATDLAELIDLEADVRGDMGSILPRFAFVLDDLVVVDEEALRARAVTATVRLMWLLMKNARRRKRRELLTDLERWEDLFRDVSTAPNGFSAMRAIMSYIFHVSKARRDDLIPLARRVGPTAIEAVMTGAEILKNEGRAEGKVEGRAEGKVEGRAEGKAEGRAEGRAEGKVEGKAELLLRQLAVRFGSVPDGIEQRIRGATLEELDVFAERVLTAETAEDVVA